MVGYEIKAPDFLEIKDEKTHSLLSNYSLSQISKCQSNLFYSELLQI